MLDGLFGTTELTKISSRLARLELKVDAILEHLSIDWESKLSDVDRDVLELLQRGEKLQAVKLYRNRTGSRLLDAKRHVEGIG